MKIVLIHLALLVQVMTAGETKPLFNGKDLSGWTFDVIDGKTKPEEIWSVKDGVIICKGRPPAVMRTLGEYSDYELTVEWQWAPGGKAPNSGVLVHASKPREMHVWPKSIEVQLRSGDAGDFWVIGETLQVEGSTPEGRRWINKSDSAEKPVGEWNSMKIRCEKDTLKVWVNGVLVNDAKALSATKGAICLQSENDEIHFRKVELTPISQE
jgi:hypothetical protein